MPDGEKLLHKVCFEDLRSLPSPGFLVCSMQLACLCSQGRPAKKTLRRGRSLDAQVGLAAASSTAARHLAFMSFMMHRNGKCEMAHGYLCLLCNTRSDMLSVKRRSIRSKPPISAFLPVTSARLSAPSSTTSPVDTRPRECLAEGLISHAKAYGTPRHGRSEQLQPRLYLGLRRRR